MPRFEIEYILARDAGVAVMAHQLDSDEFRVTPSSTLGGVPLLAYLDMPRKLLPDGSLDLKFFAFQLANRDDTTKLAVGQVAELLP